MKEIIIDGVCINNCEYSKIIPYDYPTSGIDIECYIDYRNEITKDCKENHNCLYKQLKRLEEKYNKIVEISKENLIKYEDLRIDNQKLIIEIENLKSQFEIETLKNNDTNECIYRSNLLNKYKYALEEIKEMLPEQIDITELICIYKNLYNKVNEAIGE